jgi:hypothetical protein
LSILIVDGVIEEIGYGSYSEGERTLSFIKINGTRVKNVVCDDFMRSFLKVGRQVKLSLVPRIFGTHTLYSAQLADGEVVKLSAVKPIAMTFALSVGIMVLLSPFFIGVLRATHSIGLSLCIFAALGSAMAYLVLRSHFKARRVFDKS